MKSFVFFGDLLLSSDVGALLRGIILEQLKS